MGKSVINVEKMVEDILIYNHETEEDTVTTTTKYIIGGRFTMWVSPELRVSGSRDIGGIQVQVESDTPATGNIYELLYNKLKTMKTCTDSI